MLLRTFHHIQTKLAPFAASTTLRPYHFSCYSQHTSYQLKKAQRYLQKSKQKFTVDPSSLISSQILIDALVPGFFTNQLTLEKLPQRKTTDPKLNYFQNSYARITLPLSSKPKLRQKLNKLFDKEVRIGRIFELMDSIAGIVSYSHCHGGFTPGDSQANEMVCVTGSVELLQLFDKIDIAKDLTMEGYLTHVGKTSMEIEINVSQENQLRANSIFTMIARSSKDQNRGFEVPALSFEGLREAEHQKAMVRLQHGKLNVVRRRKEMQSSYDKTHPSLEDIQQIHALFLKRKAEQATLTESSNPISKTLVETCEIMHTQQRNLHGKTFGGFLIRNMIELAWVAGCKYAEDFVIMQDLTNIYFKKPVDVGCRLTLKATVTFVAGNRLIVTVEAFTSKFSEKTETLACYMHLISKSSKQMKRVHPESYGQSLQYLSSRRAFYELFC